VSLFSVTLSRIPIKRHPFLPFFRSLSFLYFPVCNVKMFHGPETAIVSQLVSSQFSLIEDDGGLGAKGGGFAGRTEEEAVAQILTLHT
jgi:hypothetical protein